MSVKYFFYYKHEADLKISVGRVKVSNVSHNMSNCFLQFLLNYFLIFNILRASDGGREKERRESSAILIRESYFVQKSRVLIFKCNNKLCQSLKASSYTSRFALFFQM